MDKIQMSMEGVLELILISIELGKIDNAKSVAQDALNQLKERSNKKEEDDGKSSS